MIKCSWQSIVAAAAALLVTGIASATPIQNMRTETNVDWTSAGIGGVGGGSGTINLTGVSGPILKAFLYWHGIDTQAGGGNGSGNLPNPLTHSTFAGGYNAAPAGATLFIKDGGNYSAVGTFSKAMTLQAPQGATLGN